jgi:hypothetical protein
MKSEQAWKLIELLRGNWPSFCATPQAQDQWLAYFEAHDFAVSARAAARLKREDEHAPTEARFRDAAKAVLAELGGRNLETGECPLCEDGWIVVVERSDEHPHGLLARCPNGCQPNPQRGRGAHEDEPGVPCPPHLMEGMRATLRAAAVKGAPLAQPIAAMLPDGTKLRPRAAAAVADAMARMEARKREAEMP